MSKSDYQTLMDQTFKGSFISNTLTKLLSKEISPQDFKKLISEKRSEISSKNPSSTEDQKYQLLMLANDEKTDSTTTISSQKVIESFDKSEKDSAKKIIQNSMPLYFILVLLGTLFLSMLMTASNIKLGKPALISEGLETEQGNFKILEEANENKVDIELSSETKDVKFNLNKHSLLIMPKMKKVIFPTFEGVLGFIIKYGLSIVNISIALFGRFFNGKNIKWLKIRIAIVFACLPIIRIYMLNKINNQFVSSNNSQNVEFYKSKELFQYNPRNLPYNLYVEIANSLFSFFLALNHVSGYVIESFYKSNNFVCEYIKNFFEVKNKLS
jgi:hypothetical protein